MRIALLTPYFLPTIGGSELYVYNLARFLNRKGEDVSVLTTNICQGKEADLRPFEKMSSISIRRFKVMKVSRKLTRVLVSMYVPRENIYREVKRMNFDILHYHNVTDLTFPVVLSRLKIPKILTCHTLYEVTNYHWMFGPRAYFFKKIINQMDVIHALSPEHIDILTRINVDQKRIVMIPPGVLVDDFYVSPERRENVILFVGRISREKSIETLLKAILTVNFKCELWIVGTIQDRKYFLWLKEKYFDRFNGNIKIFGSLTQNELKECYAKASIFVLPSRMETFGLVLLEAMASKLPVISTDTGAAKILIKNWENGFITPIGDWRAMAEKIELLVTDGSLRRKMGEKNRKLVEERFDADASFSKLREVYSKIVERKRCTGVC